MSTAPKNGRSAPAPLHPPSDETLNRYLAVQEQRLALEIKQADIQLRELDHNQKIADKSIEAQERDRKHSREEVSKRLKAGQNFSIFIVALVLAFACYAIYAGQTALVMDLVKVIVAFAGGMGYQAYRDKRRSKDESED